ncbi:MAG: Type 1 glutamine amidotransferase-like domain-containing protein [Patescibacteria group bacterium]|nr:Type 1 glutamine amidotransferase-like domain-containing protein [Patescibacteria group bacterium]
MKRIILFSTPTSGNLDKILSLVFPKEMEHKAFAYMPSDGANCPQKYRDEWKSYAEKYDAEFKYIDNSKEIAVDEVNKLLGANILIITGGNTFKLLDNLRKSGLDKAIKEFANRNEFVLAGFSAGALVLTPTIEVCNLPNYDKNDVGLKDLTGLNIVNFEVFPHYSEQEHKDLLSEYKTHAKNEVKEITNEDCIVLDP